MFDPHGIGPRSQNSYSINKGRVIQRKIVSDKTPLNFLADKERIFELLKANGYLFGKGVNHWIFQSVRINQTVYPLSDFQYGYKSKVQVKPKEFCIYISSSEDFANNPIYPPWYSFSVPL